MSTVAKVFVVLNLLLAGLFLGSAAALLGHSDNWKARHDKKVDEMAAAQKDWNEAKAKLESDNAKLAGDKNTADSEAKKNRGEADVLRTQVESLTKAHNDLAASLAAATRALQVAQATIQNGRNLVDELQKERQTLIDNLTAARAEKDAAVKMQNQLDLNLSDLSRQHQDVLAKLSDSELKLQHANFALEQWQHMYPGGGPGSEQPNQTARVLAADNEANIIVISLGSEDGVKAGFRYTVSRGSSFVAQIEITHVEAKQSAGRVLTGMSKGPVRPGDDAATAMMR